MADEKDKKTGAADAKPAAKKAVTKKKTAKRKITSRKPAASAKSDTVASQVASGRRKIEEKLKDMGLMRDSDTSLAARYKTVTDGLNISFEFILIALVVVFMVIFLAIFGDDAGNKRAAEELPALGKTAAQPTFNPIADGALPFDGVTTDDGRPTGDALGESTDNATRAWSYPGNNGAGGQYYHGAPPPYYPPFVAPPAPPPWGYAPQTPYYYPPPYYPPPPAQQQGYDPERRQ